MIYLDNNATTQTPPEVVEAMLPFFTGRYGNPSSAHVFGSAVALDVARARAQVAALLHAQPSEIIFTGGGTESDSLAILGALRARPHQRHFITSAVEHPAILRLLPMLQETHEVTVLAVDAQGLLDLDSLRAAIRDDTALVSLMTANNETGVRFPIAEVGAICRERGALLHTDGAQATGKIPLDVQAMNVDLLTIAGHKLHAPKGIGALYVREGTPLMPPFMLGGGQERGLRSGTENVPYIMGLGQAAELAQHHLASGNSNVRKLRDRLEQELVAQVPGAMVNGHRACRLPNTTNLSFPGVRASALVDALSEEGVCISPGAACHAGEDRPSPVLKAMGIADAIAVSAVRLSLSRYTTAAEIDAARAVIVRTVDSLRANERV